MAYQTFQQEYMQMPVVTRTYATACVVTTLAVVRIAFMLSFQWFKPYFDAIGEACMHGALT